jgi:hypothetical protein
MLQSEAFFASTFGVRSHRVGSLADLDGPDSTGCAGFAGLRQRGTGTNTGLTSSSVCAQAQFVRSIELVRNYSGNRHKQVCERSPPDDDLLLNVKEGYAIRAMGASGRREMALWARDGAAGSEAMVAASHSR